ncbi:hypothetical protein DFH28DRAFT_1130377 [Melampsora americana]|nr:hypothetical protein DFH28DRAFT_1130377 [Melampsora americana]
MIGFVNTSHPPLASSVSTGFPTPPSSPLARPLSSPPALRSSSAFLQIVSDHLDHQSILDNKSHPPPIFCSNDSRAPQTDDIPTSSTTINPVLFAPAPILRDNVRRVSQSGDTPPALPTENLAVISPRPFMVSTDITIDPKTENHHSPVSGVLEHFSNRDHEGANPLSDHTVSQQIAGLESTSNPELRDLPVFDPSSSNQTHHNQDPTDKINDDQPRSSDQIGEESTVISKETDPPKRKTKKARPAYEVAGRLPRPPNSWILYRSEKILEMKSMDLGLAQSILSKEIAARWREEPSEVKKLYERKAEIIKAEHAAKHPDYKYNPKRHKKNVEKSQNKSTPISFEEKGKDQNKIVSQGKSRVDDQHHSDLKHQRSSFNFPPTPNNSISTVMGEDDEQSKRKLNEDSRFQSPILDGNLFKAFPVLSQLIAHQTSNPPLQSTSTSTERYSTRSSMKVPNQFQDLSVSSNQGGFEHHHHQQHTDSQLVSPTTWAPPWQSNHPSSIPIEYLDIRNCNRNLSYPLSSIPTDHHQNRFSLGSQLQWTPNLLSTPTQQYLNPNYLHHRSDFLDGSHPINRSNWQDPRLSNWSTSFNLQSSSNHPTTQNQPIDQNPINLGLNSFINDDSNPNLIHSSLPTFWNLGNQ